MVKIAMLINTRLPVKSTRWAAGSAATTRQFEPATESTARREGTLSIGRESS